MGEGSTGLLVFFAIAIVASVLWHYFVAHFPVAVAGATITSVVAFQIASYWHAGFLDAFWVIAVITTFGVSLVVAVVVGLPIRRHRIAVSVQELGQD